MLVGFVLERLEQLVEALGETGYAFFFELVGYVGHVDADLAEGLDLSTGRICTLVHGPGNGAMVREGGDRGVRHRVDRVRPDEGVHVEKVRICGVLG